MEEIKTNGDDHFEVKGISLYLKGVNITIPEFLALEIVKRRECKEDLNAVLNFWKQLALNPDPRCRENLFTFLSKHDIVVTPSGNFIAYRNVNIKKQKNKKLDKFITESWLKVKKQKKGAKNFNIYVIGDSNYELLKNDKNGKGVLLGNLDELYKNLSASNSEVVYTDARTGTFDIQIGKVVSMPREETDASQDNECSAGLHLASSSWLTENYYGEQGIVCLVSPMNIVSVPYADAGKLRCCEYLPIALAEYKNKKIITVDAKTFDHDYTQHTSETLDQMLKNSSLEELKSHQILPKELNDSSLSLIRADLKMSLKEMSNVVNKRIVKDGKK